MKTVKINTKAWTRNTYCDKNTGKCCAIGFIAKAELQREGIKNPRPIEISNRACELHGTPAIPDDIAEINDDYYGQERRKALRKAFRDAGYRLVFEN